MGDGHVCVCITHRSYARVAAGATWTLVLASAPWAARHDPTSVIDTAGAIYVLGGFGIGDTYFNDVWVGTNGGANRTRMDYEGRRSGTKGW
jgi:hypothetical protein